MEADEIAKRGQRMIRIAITAAHDAIASTLPEDAPLWPVGDASPRFSTNRATNIDLATDSTGSPHRRFNRRRSGDGCMRRRTFSRPDENRPHQIRLHENHLRQ